MKRENAFYSILIADESFGNRAFLADLFCHDFHILEAADGTEALAAFEKHKNRIILILLDIAMPGPDSQELLPLIRACHPHSQVPAIGICKNPLKTDYADHLDFSEYIFAPFHEHLIRHRVVNTLLLFAMQKLFSTHWPGILNQPEFSGLFTQKQADPQKLADLEQALRLLDQEQKKFQFFFSVPQEAQFEFTANPPVLSLSRWGASHFGLQEQIPDPLNNMELISVLGKPVLDKLKEILLAAHPKDPVARFDCKLNYKGETHWHRIISHTIWSQEESPSCLGVIGKIQNVDEEYSRLVSLEHMASHDSLTGLLNRTAAKTKVTTYLNSRPDTDFAMVIFDLDYFKDANDQFGHLFGDKVLQYVSENLLKSIRSNDVAARIGGDEFLIFLEYKQDPDAVIHRIFHCLTGRYGDFAVSVSMGIAVTAPGRKDYETLLHCADQALYAAKRAGRGQYHFYNDSLNDVFPALPSSKDEI